MRNPIDDAIAALRRGDQAKAFALLRGQLARDPKDATAWLWMSEATPNIESKIDALERFIAMASDHPRVPSAHIRLQYLKSQLEQVVPSPPPPVEIGDNEAEDEPISPLEVIAPPPTPKLIHPTQRPSSAALTAPPTTPAQRESLLSGVSRFTPRPAPPPDERGGSPAPASPMTVQTSARITYQPVIPDLLQSLLETAPMPHVRTDGPQEPRPSLDTAPRSAVRPTEFSQEGTGEASRLEAEEIIVTPMADSEALLVPKSLATPWWAWTLILLMALQILLLVYIILRIELVLATVR